METSASYPDVVALDDGGVSVFSPAKINLGLRVMGRRPDGYHELDTVFQEISWTDQIDFHPATEWSLEVRGFELDIGESNLVTRAAFLLSHYSTMPCKARVVLRKSIPMGGGLGGGSSNGAITLIGLSRLWGLDWPIERLHPIAEEIGSDCPFFLYGGMARGMGRGERLTLLPGCHPGLALLVVPPYGISTGWVFEQGGFPLTDDEKNAIFKFCPDSDFEPGTPFWRICNDLENIVLNKYPDLLDIRRRLLDLGAEAAALSGSGSTVFGLFQEYSRAMHAAQQFESPFQTRICRMVSRRRTDSPAA